MRVKHIAWAEDFLKSHPDTVVQDPTIYRGNWKKRFPKDQALHVEIGAGKGQFVIEMAKKHPEWNFIAIEKQASVLIRILEKYLEEPVDNLQLICWDADQLLDIFAEGEVDEIYLNFSDPWPKKRHSKRRLTSERFLRLYEKVLKPQGSIQFKTDNRGLFEFSLLSFSAYPVSLEEVYLDLHQEEDLENVQTEYEEKFSKLGQPIYKAKIKFYP